jgi:hypothetical protein
MYLRATGETKQNFIPRPSKRFKNWDFWYSNTFW